VEGSRQGAIIRGLAAPQPAAQADVTGLANALMQEMRKSGAELQVK
jgi:hypothetical protein